MKLSKILRKVIDLASAIRAYWDAELPKRHPRYPLVEPGADDGPPPREEKQLAAFLRKLPKDSLDQLLLVMSLGSGDFETEALAENYESLSETFDDPDAIVNLLLEKTPLAEYLADGLQALATHNLDVDNLPLHKAGSGK